jgi:transposase
MARVDKVSLRQEFVTLKSQFKRLNDTGKLNDESRVLIQGMVTLFEVLIAVFMEKRTVKNTRNSSLPSSQTGKDETASKPGSKGKGKGFNGIRSGNTRTIETVVAAEVNTCEVCGEDLRNIASEKHERRTRIDIIFEKTVTHVDAEIKECPRCGAQTKGTFPQDMAGPRQYGPGVKAYALNLLIAQMLSLNRVQESISVLIGETLSEATILKGVLRLHQALEPWEKSAREQLLRQQSMHTDETGFRVDRKQYWIHVYASGDLTLKFLHPKRGREAIEEIGLIPRYEGTVIHDCWASYLSYDHCGHALCGSHLLRELVFVIDSNGYRWAVHMKRLLQQTCALVAQRESKHVNAEEYKKLRKRYRTILTHGEKQLPPIPPRGNGKRGRIAKSDAHNLWERMKQYEDAVLLFAKLPEVSFTNNRAERDLRMSKVKQKVSGCFRTRVYAEAYCRISSYLQTMAYRGYNPLVAIQIALAGQIDVVCGE